MIKKVLAAVDISDPNNFRPSQFSDLGKILNLILPLLMSGIAVILLFILILGGITILTAGGNSEKLKKGQQTFTYGILGLVIIVSSYLFVKILGAIFNISLPF